MFWMQAPYKNMLCDYFQSVGGGGVVFFILLIDIKYTDQKQHLEVTHFLETYLMHNHWWHIHQNGR